MKKEKIKVFLTSKLGIAILTGFIFFNIGGCTGVSGSSSTKEEINLLNTEVEKSKKTIEELQTLNSNLQVKVDEAKPWFDMKEEERKIQQEELKKQQEAKAAEEQAKKEADEKAKREAEEQARLAKEAEEKKGYDTGITYQQLARTPEDFKMKKIKFKGKVIQVMEGSNETQIRLAVNGNYDNVVLCSIPKELTKNNRILEDDQITVMGKSLGLFTYKSTMGGEITVPSMTVDKIDR